MKTDTLADWLHAWTYDTRPFSAFASTLNAEPLFVFDKRQQDEAKRDLRMALRQAERVHLDDNFLREIAKKTIAPPPEMLAMAGLAKLPFNRMFVEWDDNVRVRAVAEAAVEAGGKYAFDPETDFGRAGLLFERLNFPIAESWMISHVSDSEGLLPVWPYGALFGRGNNDLDQKIYQSHPSLTNLFASGWGYVDEGGTSLTQYAIHRELLERGGAIPEQRFFMPVLQALRHFDLKLPAPILGRMLREAANQASGKLRWGVAILASLNTVPTARVARVAKGAFHHRMHAVPRLSTVHVKIDAKPGHEVSVYDRHFHEATGRHNRRHEVRGHWRVVDTRRKNNASSSPYWMCAHTIADEDGLYALCGKCGHLLRWIDLHERGDEALGYVFKDGYDVKG